LEKNVPVIEPAVRWTQSLNEVYIEVKWATWFDSPGCLDTFDHVYSAEGNQLLVEAMCRTSDKAVLRYKLDVELWGEVTSATF
jgi:hypothetical protein